MKDSTALIKLTKSEIEAVIIALNFTQQTAQTFSSTGLVEEHMFWKLKHDFIQIQQDIIDGEKQNESKNKMEEKIESNKQTN